MIPRVIQRWHRRAMLLAPVDQPLRRHPGDVLRLALGGGLFLSTAILAALGALSTLETNLFRLINDLPGFLSPPLGVLMQAGSYAAVLGAAMWALIVHRRRLALLLLAGGSLAWLIAKPLKLLVARGRPAALLDIVTIRGVEQVGLGFPSGHAVIAATLVTIAGPYLTVGARRLGWAIVWIVALARVYVGAHLPIDVIGGVALGWMLGAAVRLIAGAPGGVPTPSAIGRRLAEAGLPLRTIDRARVDARGSAPFLAEAERGQRLFIKTVGREQRDADWLFKLWRFVLFREIEDEAPFATPKQQIEHEAYLALLAERAGVRTPRVELVSQLRDGTAILVQRHVAGTGFDTLDPAQITDDLLRQIWQEVTRLHQARIAHRDLRRANVLIDEQRRPWLIDFGFSEAAASDHALARDTAELLVSLGAVAGAERTVRQTAGLVSPTLLSAALRYLQPLALGSVTRAELRARPALLSELRAAVGTATGTPPAPSAPLLRIEPRVLLGLLMAGAALYLLLPQIGELREALAALRQARWELLGLALLGSAVTYVLAALAQIAPVERPLPLGRAVLVQLAATFANRLAPQGLGGALLIERSLERTGLDRAGAVTAVTLMLGAGAVNQALMLLWALWFLGTLEYPAWHWPSWWVILAVAAATLALIGVAMRLPLVRRRLLTPLLSAGRKLLAILRQPWRALKLFASSASVSLVYALTLAACLRAFGSDVSLLKIIAVYQGGATIGALSPTPGGLGALEAALIAGLGVIGLPFGPAVTGVLTFRLLTYWLPILPGFAAFHWLRRQEVI